MMAVCDGTNPYCLTSCQSYANGYYNVVHWLGGSAYQAAQDCSCN
jgi:hypothetical protein